MPSGITDEFTGMYATITGDHHYIHMGMGYVHCGVTASINAGASESISFKTPPATSGKTIHFRPVSYASTANALAVSIVQDAVMTGGTAIVPQNLNRFKPNASQVQISTGATLSVAGTGGTIFSDSVGSGGASNRGAGSGGANEERVLKPDTMYSITFSNIGSSTATLGYYTLFWYEED